ncbi:MAG: glycosyltransferase [Candidatus Aminicenantes bacterium]|nr:glycosyltransferase [Candidatus Aminicenantes bacterium]NIM79659.1 glycosyltransferase [Candidatus Aminicenantes bacterium]NIN18985.1 glycosyltransferase [Candidatus Aminicenantes bacterium]NIN42887.1 glycosyltransferase [Candidatus Aminicenantes bacterium]NIN85624.1 glycosyltransferase [Candidatus Aminicenantes bacterium]
MNIHQFLTSHSYGDAIGNEALEIRNFLRDQGHHSEIFALFYHPRYADQIINYLEYDRYSAPENIIIFHFSIGSPVTKKFLRVPDKKVIIYHNITPFEFFLDYHRVLAKDCYKGRIELKNLADKVDLALGDSVYNESELKEAGFPNTGVLPLVMNFEKFEKETVPVLKEIFADGKTNILFVGRIIPNKMVEDVIKTFYLYQEYFNANSRLFIVGEYRGFERYYSALQNLVSQLEIKNVHFTGHVPDDELISYFKLSHLYLHMSEHEGFCAPIPESFYLDIPVVAFNAGAVQETMNSGGVLVKQKDFLQAAALIDQILTDSRLKEKILRSQQEALKKYLKKKTGKILLEHLNRL